MVSFNCWNGNNWYDGIDGMDMPTKNSFSSKPWNWTTGRPHEGTGCASCWSPLENMKSSCGNLKGCLVNMPLNQATDHQVEFGCFTATICQQSFMVRIDRDKWWSTSSIAKSGLLQSIPGLTLSPGIRVSTQLICLLALPADQRRLDDSSRLLASILQMLFLIPTQWQRHNTWYLLIGGPTG